MPPKLRSVSVSFPIVTFKVTPETGTLRQYKVELLPLGEFSAAALLILLYAKDNGGKYFPFAELRSHQQ